MAFLELQNVSVSFSGFLAVHQVSLSVDKGETRVIIGPNGAGKTTIIDMITGKTAPTSGKVLLDGAEISARNPHEIAANTKWAASFRDRTCSIISPCMKTLKWRWPGTPAS